MGKFGGSQRAYRQWSKKFGEHLKDWDPEKFMISCIAFVDDCYLIAKCHEDAQAMLRDVVEAFKDVQLFLAAEKVKFMTDKLSEASNDCKLYLDNVEIEQVQRLKILGSIVTNCGSEKATVEHRIGAGWGCYNKWRHILESKAQLSTRLAFFEKQCLKVCFGV